MGTDAERDHQLLLHTVGNLTLTGYNSQLANAPFADKRIDFARSNLSLNAELAAEIHWGAAAIRWRGSQLAERILERWPALVPELAVEGTSAAPGRVASVRPVAVLWRGQRLPVRTWIEVVVKTLQALSVEQPTLLTELAYRRPTYLSQQPEPLRRAVEISQGWYYDGHNNADGHRRFCRYALEQAGLAETIWEVETVAP